MKLAHTFNLGNSLQKAKKHKKVSRKAALEIYFVTFELFVVSFSDLIYARSSVISVPESFLGSEVAAPRANAKFGVLGGFDFDTPEFAIVRFVCGVIAKQVLSL